MNFFGQKKVDPIEQAKEWKRNLAKESRKLDRDILALQRAEKRAIKECKIYAKKGENNAARILAKEIVNTRKACDRIRMAKIQMNSVSMALQQSISMIKVQGCISASVDVMREMNNLLKLPEIQQTMSEMAREMARAGLIEETINETFEMMEPEDLAGEADEEVNRIMEEITAGILEPAGSVPTKGPVKKVPAEQQVQEEQVGTDDVADEAEDEELQKIRSRLQAL